MGYGWGSSAHDNFNKVVAEKKAEMAKKMKGKKKGPPERTAAPTPDSPKEPEDHGHKMVKVNHYQHPFKKYIPEK